MKPFIRIKTIKGRNYAYEITPYYDPKTKNTKQKSKYLGVYENGEIVRKQSKIPKCVFDYGVFVPFMDIIRKMKLDEILESLVSSQHAKMILALALNRVVNPVSACNVQTWYEGTILVKCYGNLPLSSQTLSNFMETLGGSSIPQDFSKELIAKNTTDAQPLLYDITSLSSSSSLMDILEYGYNRDGDNLPQLNLSIVAHKDLGIPLFFDVHPGSVVDVNTLKNTTKRLVSYGLTTPTLILDRGFFSETNLNDLIEHDFSFIMPASFSSKGIKSLVSNFRPGIENSEFLQLFHGQTLFVKPITFAVRKATVEGFLFYDLKREKEEKTVFYTRLYELRKRLEERKLRAWEQPQKVFENITRSFAKYFSWEVRNGRFLIGVKTKAVTQRTNRMGFTVLLSRGNYSWEETLMWTRERDMIEKMFLRLKKDLACKPMRAHKTEVAKGWIFIAFLALILRCRLSKMLVETGLTEHYSIPLLLLTLNRLKQVELSDGSMIKTEMTKKQRLIFEAMKIQP